MSTDLAKSYQERGYDVGTRDAGIVLDVPNPDITADSYFHGDNPHTVGFGSRGPEAEFAGADLTVEPGQSTGEALANEEGAGWQGDTSGAATDTQQGARTDGEPDESWRNADIDAWAEANGVELSSSLNKAEKLEAIRASRE